MPSDPSDARQPNRRRTRADWQLPDGWIGYPPDVNPTRGVPRNDHTRWWRLQPGERRPDGTWARRNLVHGGTCGRWPTGKSPADWTWHNRADVKAMLAQPAGYIPCPGCCLPWITGIWPHDGTGPVTLPAAER